jgi:ribonucleoside-triphosphate reductase
MPITIQTTQDECVIFKKKRIVDTLIRETDVPEHEAFKIARSVERQVKRLQGETITTSQIREMVDAKLLERGYVDEARQHQRMGLPVAEITGIITGDSSDNANLQRNPETIHKFGGDAVYKQYAINYILPDHLAKAHDKGELHVHDLEYFAARPINCLMHDLRYFIKRGLMADGRGDHTSVAGPAKSLPTLANHTGEILLAGQQNCSGGQGFAYWNVFTAPYARGLTYKEIKQSVQMLVYNLNMAYSNRGGQVPFTSLNIEFTVPEFLKEEPAWYAGLQVGVYGDYEEEVRLLNRAFIEVMMEGDYMGKPHLFPNSIWMIREEMMTEEFEDDLLKVHQLSAKYSTPYFSNCIPKWTGGNKSTMGCRTGLNETWTGNWERDTLRTGNLAYISINLPRIAYKSETEGEFFNELDRVLGLAEEILLIRRERALTCLNDLGILPFLSQKDEDGEMYYRIDDATLSFGLVGLNEAIKAMGYEDILDDEGKDFSTLVLDYINEYAKDLVDETGYRWTILQTPGETTTHRFATLDVKKYGKLAIVNGNEGAYYYTNSTHVPVDSDIMIPQRLKSEESFHGQTAGGNICHIWLGEAFSNPDSLMTLTKRIATKTDMGFWAYSSSMSYCFGCNSLMRGLQEQCGNCGEKDNVEWYDRITGYVQQVGHSKSASGGWNPGKQKELMDRSRYDV